VARAARMRMKRAIVSDFFSSREVNLSVNEDVAMVE
jgi:hypothetical protein